MIVTFDPVLPKTVSSNYSWDDGNPSSNGNVEDLTVDSEGYYVGYAPFVLMRLSSVPVFQGGDESTFTVFRSIDFTDYYNCQANQLTSLGFDEDFYCHVYVMPGTYDAALTYTPYTITTDTGETPTILYQQEAISEYQAPVLELISENDRGRIFWNWEKLICNPEEICDKRDPTIKSITWEETECDQRYAKKWEDAMLRCLLWKDTKSTEECKTWKETASGQQCETWKSSLGNCFEAPQILTPLDSVTVPLANKIKVLEITPTAYLSAMQPDELNRVSPLSATLTARFTRCGSFPIEKIVWDLGDGSPLLTQRRWSIKSDEPFVYTGVISNDPADPRNYDVSHVYNVTKESGFTFYPSITAYAYSTGTTDCASAVIGPVQPKLYDANTNEITLLQNNTNDQKTFSVLLRVGDDVATAKFEK